MSTRSDDSYRRLADLAREMSQHLPESTASAFDDLIASAVTHIPAAQYAGITVVSMNGDVATPAAAGEYPRVLDGLQQKHGEGPCFDAATDHDSYFLADLHTETRWPRFCSDARALTPVRSIASYQLFAAHDSVGALNLYAETPDAFGQHDRDLGYIFAAHAAIVWAAVSRGEHFRSALASRDRLRESVPQPHLLARVAGAEFIAVLENVDHDFVDDVSDSIHLTLTEPIEINDTELRLRASVGLVHIRPHDNRSAQEIVSAADTAMYYARAKGGGHTIDFHTLRLAETRATQLRPDY